MCLQKIIIEIDGSIQIWTKVPAEFLVGHFVSASHTHTLDQLWAQPPSNDPAGAWISSLFLGNFEISRQKDLLKVLTYI